MILKINNLEAGFGGSNILHDISLTLKEGECIGLVGESGCGKSLTALSILNLLPYINGKITKGEILFNGEDLLKAKDLRDIRGSAISIIFQDPFSSLDPSYTIYDQFKEIFISHTNYNKKEIRNKISELIKKVKLDESHLSKYPFQLSGGMLQRVLIAMAISLTPKLLIADEPTTALDASIKLDIIELLKQIQKSNNMSIIFISHDLALVKEICDRVYIMYSGMVVEEGSTVYNNPLHPYTKGLIKCVKSLYESKTESLYSIKGSVSDVTDTGCRFYKRCDYKKPECRTKKIELKVIDRNRSVRCLLY